MTREEYEEDRMIYFDMIDEIKEMNDLKDALY